MEILYLIPARAGSKVILHKNTRLLGNKPLINYTIECALEVTTPNNICISTDDEKVIKIAEQYAIKVPFIRPSELCTDNASQYEVIKHAIGFYEKKSFLYDTLILLQPTSPFRQSSHIIDALKLYNRNVDMIVSVKKTKSNPYFVLFEEENGYLIKCKNSNYKRRQDCPDVWELNGAVYIINIKSLTHTKSLSDLKRVIKFEMPEICSIDIDTQYDWLLAEYLLKSGAL